MNRCGQFVGVGGDDLLAIDEDGRLAVIEFKRQQTTRDTIAQILDYASSLRLMAEALTRIGADHRTTLELCIPKLPSLSFHSLAERIAHE